MDLAGGGSRVRKCPPPPWISPGPGPCELRARMPHPLTRASTRRALQVSTIIAFTKNDVYSRSKHVCGPSGVPGGLPGGPWGRWVGWITIYGEPGVKRNGIH